MKHFLPLVALLAFGPAAHADLNHKIQSSISLQVGGAMTTAERIGSTFSISGSGVDTTDGTTANTISAGTITSGVYAPGTISVTQDTPGNAFSFSQSYTQADALPTSAVTVGASQNFGDIYSVSGGTTGDLAGQVTSAHTFASVDAGGANTAVTSQFVSEVTVR